MALKLTTWTILARWLFLLAATVGWVAPFFICGWQGGILFITLTNMTKTIVYLTYMLLPIIVSAQDSTNKLRWRNDQFKQNQSISAL
ncbi:hypothetical protein EI77_02405 [Prosthecobacter fusiformis]|uniref:Uncharacterized protein n=1 Tax=Prosthecobacter fusiformis TaxID=48464 RepID=A0A4V3FFL6_9BACT|nr:hypothetical protein EI77_02405 [Prosthecobacter fusiformis]